MISWFRFGLLASLALCLSTSVSAAPTISSQSGVGSQLNSTNRKQGGGTLELPSTTTNQHSTDNGTRSGQVAQIPQRFLGCWEGQVSEANLTDLDVFSRPILGRWLTKNYELCFVRTPEGAFEATMATGSVEPHIAVIDVHSHLVPTASSPERLALVGDLKIEERAMTLSGYVSGPAGVVHERVRLDGHLRNERLMEVVGDVDGSYNDAPWFTAAWRTDFRRKTSP